MIVLRETEEHLARLEVPHNDVAIVAALPGRKVPARLGHAHGCDGPIMASKELLVVRIQERLHDHRSASGEHKVLTVGVVVKAALDARETNGVLELHGSSTGLIL